MREAILALDVATNTGWAEGTPGGLPRLGSIRFGDAGGSHEAAFAEAMGWIGERVLAFPPRLLVMEAPLPPSFMRGKTNVDTARKLLGLSAIIGGTAHKFGCWNIREASVADVRHYFLGKRNMPGKDAKRATIAKCREMGLEPKNDNEADAAALWFYTCSKL